MSTEVEVVSHLPAVRERSSVLLMPVMDVNTAMHRLQEFQQFCANYLSESRDGGNDGGDYGVIPGTKKKTLLKSGADKLCEVYGLYDEYETISTVEDWDKGLFDYTLKCVLKSRRDDSVVGTGVGSCSSWESKYRYREAKRTCPACGKATIIAGKAEYGGGFLCWKKEGKSDGCGAKYKDDDRKITDQVQGRVENPDIADSKNTVLKMAKKRAKIDATIGATRSAGIFTQDLDDVPPPAPAKPPVERTTEPIEIRGKGNGAGVELTEKGDTPAPEQIAVEYVTPGQAANFHRTFKDACAPGIDADTCAHDWLAKGSFFDPGKPGENIPSAKGITKNDFVAVRTSAITYARSLKP